MRAAARAPAGGPAAAWALAAAAARGANRCSRPLCCAIDPAPEQADLYGIVGAPPTATTAELKRAFRQRAKQLHPDAAPGRPGHDAFAQLLAAYQVLSEPRTRQLYDLSRDRGGPSVLRAAAAAGVPGGAAAAYEDVEVDLSWGLGGAFKRPLGGGPTALDRVRQELQGELHSAVRRAYLGPRLPRLAAGALPDAFEADERAEPSCPDLLQLVHGRQVLGAVRERRRELLAQRAAAAALGGPAAAPHAGDQQRRRRGLAAPAGLDGRQAAERRGRQAAAGSLPADEQQQQDQGQGQQQQQEEGQQGPQRGGQQGQEQRDPDVLDLWLGDRLVASAVRHLPHPAPAEHQQPGQPEREQRAAPAQVIAVRSACGQLLARVEAQQLDPGSLTASSARLLNADGAHTHTVFRTQSPLVRHLTFAAEAGAFGMSGRRPSRLVVCRARRAWLPPSSLWLFKPLAHTHDIGGWCLEWSGEGQQRHPAWLHPAVLVLTAAFESLDHERRGRQPAGLFQRVRAAAAGGDHGGWRGWAASVLRFHGWRQR